MRRGLDWYKREPRAIIDSKRAARMSTRTCAVFDLLLDLIYEGGGQTPDDPAYIAGHFPDIGTAIARREIDQLIALGKIAREDGFLTNKRAKNEAKTRQNLSETRAKAGKKGGISSGFSRSASSENNDLDESPASSKTQPEREESREETPYSPPRGTNGCAYLSKLDVANAFTRFWEAYPRKVKKPKAKVILERILKRGEATPEELIEGARRYAAEVANVQPTADGRIPIAHPTTWLNEGRWQDEPDAKPKASEHSEAWRNMSEADRERYRELARQRQKEREH